MHQTLIRKTGEKRGRRGRMERGRQPRELCASMLALRSVGVESTPQGQWLGSLGGDVNLPWPRCALHTRLLAQAARQRLRRAVVVPARDGERLRRRRAAHRPSTSVEVDLHGRLAPAPTPARGQRDAAPLARQAHADLRPAAPTDPTRALGHAPTRFRGQRDAAPLARQAHADLRWRRPRALRRGDGGAWRVALLLADQHQRARGLACLARPLARRLRLRRAARGARCRLCVAAPRRGRRLRRQRR